MRPVTVQRFVAGYAVALAAAAAVLLTQGMSTPSVSAESAAPPASQGPGTPAAPASKGPETGATPMSQGSEAGPTPVSKASHPQRSASAPEQEAAEKTRSEDGQSTASEASSDGEGPTVPGPFSGQGADCTGGGTATLSWSNSSGAVGYSVVGLGVRAHGLTGTSFSFACPTTNVDGRTGPVSYLITASNAAGQSTQTYAYVMVAAPLDRPDSASVLPADTSNPDTSSS